LSQISLESDKWEKSITCFERAHFYKVHIYYDKRLFAIFFYKKNGDGGKYFLDRIIILYYNEFEYE